MTAGLSRRRSLVRLAARSVCVLAACSTFTIAGPAVGRADGSHRDHDQAREALERGQALPLADILARVRPELGGEVVGVDFERERGGAWIYEFKVIEPAGRLTKVHVDAATARVLNREAE